MKKLFFMVLTIVCAYVPVVNASEIIEFQLSVDNILGKVTIRKNQLIYREVEYMVIEERVGIGLVKNNSSKKVLATMVNGNIVLQNKEVLKVEEHAQSEASRNVQVLNIMNLYQEKLWHVIIEYDDEFLINVWDKHKEEIIAKVILKNDGFEVRMRQMGNELYEAAILLEISTYLFDI